MQDTLTKKYKIFTYGCQMNVHESEKIAGILENMGYTATEEAENAAVIVFNTCCIRDTAETKIIGNIGAVKPCKKANRDVKICVLGCMTAQDGRAAELRTRFPFLDLIMGTESLDMFGEYLQQTFNGKRIDAVQGDTTIVENAPVYRTSYPNAWVNIAYGCNNFCTYCIVPYVRGRERSRASSDIIREVQSLVNEGYREITLLGQNVNSYGTGSPSGENFHALLSDIAALDGKFRVRFMTSHPKDFNRDVISVIAQSDKICNNIHLPIQSGSNRVLHDMNRRYTREQYLGIIDDIRAAIPDCGITTDIMVGFPTEQDSDFEDTLDIVRRVRFSNAFTFIYSMRRGTPAAKMPQITYPVKKERITRLIALQNSITKELSQEYVGNTYEILVEDVCPKTSGMVCGRTLSGRLVSFPGEPSDIGNFVDVRVESHRSASLFGEIVASKG